MILNGSSSILKAYSFLVPSYFRGKDCSKLGVDGAKFPDSI